MAAAAETTTIEHYFMATTGAAPLQASDWFVGGGCTMHICGERKHFIRYTEYRKSEEREISDFAGRVAGKAIGYDDIRLRLRQPGRRTSKVAVVRNVLHVEGAHNTLSQSILMDRGLRIVPANGYGLRIYATGTGHRRRGELVGVAPQVSGLLQFGVVSAG